MKKTNAKLVKIIILDINTDQEVVFNGEKECMEAVNGTFIEKFIKSKYFKVMFFIKPSPRAEVRSVEIMGKGWNDFTSVSEAIENMVYYRSTIEEAKSQRKYHDMYVTLQDALKEWFNIK